MKTKLCKVCLTRKPLSDFSANSNTADKLRPNCRSCVSEYNREYRKKNRDHILKLNREYVANNRGHMREKTKQWRADNPDKAKESNSQYYQNNRDKQLADAKERYLKNADIKKQQAKQWKKNNPDKVAAINAKRRAQKRNAIPKWSDISAIGKFYTEARKLTESTRIQYQVDHIVPLISKVVCGLHCEDNLRVITAEENNAKKNRLVEEII